MEKLKEGTGQGKDEDDEEREDEDDERDDDQDALSPGHRSKSINQLRRVGTGRRVVEVRVYGKIMLTKPYEGETNDDCFVYKINDKVEDLRKAFGKVRSRNTRLEAVSLRSSSERTINSS